MEWEIEAWKQNGFFQSYFTPSSHIHIQLELERTSVKTILIDFYPCDCMKNIQWFILFQSGLKNKRGI